MSAQHTPGPWFIKGAFIRPVVGHRIAVMDSQPDERANARLIAAAPELLEALRDVIHSFPKFDRDKYPVIADSLDAARAAIAKATGGGA